ncbi:MAG: 3'(2'),5'-bisphosphate nucleotidase CysQ [Pseudomonadota bacterium]
MQGAERTPPQAPPQEPLPADPGLDADLALMREVAHAAGALAMQFFRQPLRSEEKPGGQGPVSEADLAVETLLKMRLMTARPSYGWLSEEAPDNATRLGCERVFILDPIDGTRAFIAGQTGFGIAIALAVQGRICAGVMHLPARGETYAARLGGGAALNGRALACGRRETLDGADVLVSRAALQPAHWVGAPPIIKRHFRPALAHRICLVAAARFDAFLTLRSTWEWDAAAADIIAREAGLAISDRQGAPLSYNSAARRLDGVIVANPSLHAAICARLHGIPGPLLDPTD